ncbi:hypothetical protein PSEUDO9AG_10558 [Pseudomonas sp. 9Ag]|nr:hypothetical protein PSEUDO9AG_10558 [Pseudomonas sp. 9Ag]
MKLREKTKSFYCIDNQRLLRLELLHDFACYFVYINALVNNIVCGEDPRTELWNTVRDFLTFALGRRRLHPQKLRQFPRVKVISV